MKRSRTLRRDLERFADRFCDVFTDEGLSDDTHYHTHVEGAQTAVERILLEQLHPDFFPQPADTQSGLGMRLRTVAPGQTRRAFREQLQADEHRAAASAAVTANAGVPPVGMNIAGIHLDQATNVGINLDGNSKATHVRRFRTRPRPPPARVCSDLTRDELLHTTTSLQHASTQRTNTFLARLIATPRGDPRGSPPSASLTPRPPITIGSATQGAAVVAVPPDLPPSHARPSAAAQRSHALRRCMHKPAPLEPTMPRHTPTLQRRRVLPAAA